jgi:DNA-binding SARP family transcriptional activator
VAALEDLRVPVHIQTLGELKLVRDDGATVAIRRTPLALLTYLARRAPRSVSRIELSTLFWGERSEERARQSLRQAVLEARQAAGDALEVTAETLRVLDGAVVLDIVQFEDDAKHNRHEAAADRWTGDFFPGASDVGGEAFERWVDAERVALQRRLGVVMQHLIGAAELRADWPAAVRWARQWTAAAPLDERAHGRLVETLRMDGHASDALEVHADFTTRLREALDIAPSPAFMSLAGGLEALVQVETARDGRRSTALRAPALIARGHELAEIMVACRVAASGKPMVVMVECGGGRGKTRLCDEIAASVGAGTLTLRARGEHGGRHTDRFGTARELLAGLRDVPGSAGASPEALAEIARLVPALATEFKYLPEPTADDAALRDALVQVLAAVSEETPVLVLLDDAHGADEASWQLLAAASSRLTGRVAMVFFLDEGARETRAALDAVLATPGVLRVRLQPLSEADVGAMLASMLDLPSEECRHLAARLHAELVGNPLLIYETVVALVNERLITLDAAGEWRVSAGLEGRPLPLPEAIVNRINVLLSRLGSHARTLVDAAAVVGTPVDGALLEAIAALPSGAASPAFRELIGRRVMTEEQGTGMLDFAHPVLGTVAYALLSPGERQALHGRVARELDARDMATTTERSVLPYHLARAGQRRSSTPAGGDRGSGITAPKRSGLRRYVRPTAALAVIGAGILGGRALLLRESRAVDAANSRRVIVGAFRASPSDQQITGVRDIAVDWIVRGMDETGLVEIVTSRAGPLGERVGVATLATDEVLQEAARVSGAGTMINGALHRIGDSVEFETMIRNTADGRLLRMIPAVRASLANPLPGIERLRAAVVGALAAQLDSSYDAGGSGPRSPPSYDAYVAFMRGESAYESGDLALATSAYTEAAASDPAYTLPVLRLMYVAFAAGDCRRVDSIATALERRAPRLSRFETHYLARVRAYCRYDWVAANEAARQMADLAPRSALAQFAAARSAIFTNRPLEALRRLRMIDPSHRSASVGDTYWLILAFALHMSGDDAELRRVLRELSIQPQNLQIVAARMYAAGALGQPDDLDAASMETLAGTRYVGRTSYFPLFVALGELRAHGKAADARRLAAERAALLAAAVLPGAPGDTVRLIRGELLYRAERWADVRRVVDTILARHPQNVYVLSLAGRTAARMDDRARAAEMSTALGRLTDPALQGRNVYGQAAIAAVLGHHDEAVRLVRLGVRNGLAFIFDRDFIFLGHADMDLESVITDRAIRTLLTPKG